MRLISGEWEVCKGYLGIIQGKLPIECLQHLGFRASGLLSFRV